jgi:2-C-methyl-D-erythritol 4-phosphate cytidylyltransferase
MGALAIVLAGGSGTRMGIDRNKVYLPLAGRPLIAWPLLTCERAEAIDHIVVVHRPADADELHGVLGSLTLTKLRAVVPGGSTRTGSELAGLAVAERLLADRAMAPSDLVFIHDGARPFVTIDLIDRLSAAADRDGGAIPGFAPHGAIGELDETGELVALPSARLRRVQTPQVFQAEVLLAAYAASQAVGFEGVDTAHVIERFGPANCRVAVVEADERNIKLTVADDIELGERLAAQWSPAAWHAPANQPAGRPRTPLQRARSTGQLRGHLGRSVIQPNG